MLITNRKSHTSFQLHGTDLDDLEWPRTPFTNSPYFAFFFTNSIDVQGDYITVVEDRPIMSVKYCLPVPVFHFWWKLQRTLQRGLSAIAEHLVILRLVVGLLYSDIRHCHRGGMSAKLPLTELQKPGTVTTLLRDVVIVNCPICPKLPIVELKSY